MIQFDRLRIAGFKSFPERTELDVGPGLNGVVGPNGCGKSNLVEAMRWVMGETSAKRMRGSGMEDVIFNGTGQRTARNIAEVSLLLNNETRTAPATYNSSDEIEITRRIERDKGSQYKINGKNARLRDVQMLFADTVTGANSPAMVSQGRITQIINAKPIDRRLVLEESAGISGLFARRHEAELRLRAADGNLLRLEDILGSMEGRLAGLKRQARQAERYRNLNTQIRQMEMEIAYLEWCAMQAKAKAVEAKFNAAESVAAEKMTTVTQLTKTQNTQSEDLAPLRKAETEAAASLQVQKIALQRLEDEKLRLEASLRETKDLFTQTSNDLAHETKSLNDNTGSLERMAEEHEALIAEEDGEGDQLAEKQKLVGELEEKVTNLEADYNTLIQGEAEFKARKQSLEDQIKQNQSRLEVLQSRVQNAETDLAALPSNDESEKAANALIADIEAREKEIETLSKAISGHHTSYDALSTKIDDARAEVSAAQAKRSEFTAEISMLEEFFTSMDDEGFKPVLDSVQAQSGFEKALSRALGDSLLASLEEDAPTVWLKRDGMLDQLPELPKGASPLLPVVEAPKQLHPALSQIGLVDDDADGGELSKSLKPGQALVSRNGTYWRWDGYCITAEAPDRQAIHLEQKNKLSELQKQKPKIDKVFDGAQETLDALITEQKDCQSKRGDAQNDMRTVETALTKLRSELSNLRENNARHDSEKTRLQDMLKTSQDDMQTLNDVLKWDLERLENLVSSADESSDDKSEELRATLMEAREALQNAIRAFDNIKQKQNTRSARLRAIADERVSLQNQTIRSRERIKTLEERKASLEEKLGELKRQPKDFEDQHDGLLTKISDLEAGRTRASDKLTTCEQDLNETIRALKVAQDILLSAKEDRAAAQATLAGLKENIQIAQAEITHKFDMKPQDAGVQLGLTAEEAESRNVGDMKSRRDKMIRDRDSMGAVNLRADTEAQELEVEVTQMLNERNDLTQAIEELRTAINKINVEARERLKIAFDTVNAHFQSLFKRLFGGGEAHLALVDDDDPLGAGLEIFAQPPGKSLQSLSLLSGGEQTMASIALIFAMFLTNPSPICVLDEIDAPLDDANVDRVCDLLDDIAARGETRFIVITHHRLTMARMDRLYGVTMAERGVSQLVSVDLQQSFGFLDEAA
jgi:chromosome segregation protein